MLMSASIYAHLNKWQVDKMPSDYYRLMNIGDPDLMLRYYARSVYNYSFTYPERQVIHLANAGGHLHEYVHLILQDRGRTGAWREEGLAQYLSTVIYPYTYELVLFQEYGIHRYISDESLDKYGELIYELYTLYTGNELSHPPDIRALYDAFSYVLILSDDDGWLRRYRIFWPIHQDRNVNDIFEDDIIGNMMSYVEAASFIAFLADIYSFETTLRLTETWVSIDDIFGKSFNELRNEWIDWLKRDC